MSSERHLIVELIGKQHNRADFSCGSEALDHSLKKQAMVTKGQ